MPHPFQLCDSRTRGCFQGRQRQRHDMMPLWAAPVPVIHCCCSAGLMLARSCCMGQCATRGCCRAGAEPVPGRSGLSGVPAVPAVLAAAAVRALHSVGGGGGGARLSRRASGGSLCVHVVGAMPGRACRAALTRHRSAMVHSAHACRPGSPLLVPPSHLPKPASALRLQGTPAHPLHCSQPP